MDNQEITHIKKILGLQHGKEYESAKGLRYGHLMIMADQDHDGSHIKGLLINFLDHFFPSLLRVPGFLLEFITPIVKVGAVPWRLGAKCRTVLTLRRQCPADDDTCLPTGYQEQAGAGVLHHP